MSNHRLRLSDFDVSIGRFPTGKKNMITDVNGVKVGQVTLIKGNGKLIPGKGPVRTGVTVVLPHSGNLFAEKVVASSFVLNGYGKTIGLVQLNELGTIETPIALTNTLNVPVVADALIDYSIANNSKIGVEEGTVNPVVGECNDGFLNDIQGRHVNKEDVIKAIETASDIVKEGNAGAGTGMKALGYKAGIGTSSRIITGKDQEYVVGSLVVSNFGLKGDLRFLGRRVTDVDMSKNKFIVREQTISQNERGSIMVVIATNAPLTSRQLKRIAKRAPLGISRTGGFASNGSGDIIISFSTENKVKNSSRTEYFTIKKINETNKLFSDLLSATVDVTEEAILNSLLMAETMTGRDNHTVEAISLELIEQLVSTT